MNSIKMGQAEFAERFGTWIAEALEAKNLTVADLAWWCMTSDTNIYSWISGTKPTALFAARIFEVLGTPPWLNFEGLAEDELDSSPSRVSLKGQIQLSLEALREERRSA